MVPVLSVSRLRHWCCMSFQWRNITSFSNLSAGSAFTIGVEHRDMLRDAGLDICEVGRGMLIYKISKHEAFR